jgi:hypothetical protein
MREWDGVCKCGKREADGKRCKLGATHQAKAVALDADDDLDFLETSTPTEDDLDFLN